MEELCNAIYCTNTNENSNTSLHPSLSGIAWQTYTSWAENTLCLSSLSLSDLMLEQQFSSTIATAVIWLLQTPHFIIQKSLLYLYNNVCLSILSLSNLLRLSPASAINLAWTIKNLRKPPQHRPHLQRWFAAKRIWSRSSTITVQQEDLVWGNHCNAYQCGLVGHRYQQISCSLPLLQLL